MKKYIESHEWAEIEGNIATIGISEYAANELGDIVYVDLPSIGDEVIAHENMCEVESVKAVSEINSPVDGVIVEVNDELESAPESINEDALNAWICKVQVTSVPDDLMSQEDYDKFVG